MLAVTPGILYTYWDVLNQLEKSGVNLLELYDYQCDKAVKEETACMGIGVEPVDTSLFDVIPLAHHPLYAICSESHPLAQKNSLTFSDLENQHLIIFGKNYKSNRRWEQTLHDRKIHHIRISETDNAVNMYKRCQDGNTLAFSPIFPDSSYPKFHCLAIPLYEDVSWSVCLITKKGIRLKPREEQLKNFLIELFYGEEKNHR